MPAEFWTEATRMTTSGLLVAAFVIPVALVAWAARPREPRLPRWKPWRVPWNGFEVVVVFLVVMFIVPPLVHELLSAGGFYSAIYGDTLPSPKAKDADPDELKTANTLRMLWAATLAIPLQLGALWFALRARYPAWEPQLVGSGSFEGKVTLAVLAWLVLTPLVLSFHAGVNAISQEQGAQPETHALAKLVGRPPLDQVLLMVEACIGAPLREEILIRGLLLSWCVGRMRVPGAGVAPLTAARPWFVMGAAVVFAASSGNRAPLIFAAVLMAGLAILWKFKTIGARRARAVYATAAFFGLMHPTWPTPIPLFVLGLGLGWLAVRTNGLLVPVLVHALFNAVSAVFVLRSGAG